MEVPTFDDRLEMFIADLLIAHNNEDAFVRVQVADEYGISTFYFNDEERLRILSTPLDDSAEIIRDKLTTLVDGKISRGKSHLCSSHDLAPVLMKAFHLPRNFHKCKLLRKKIARFSKLHENLSTFS
jgi:hypothetical protein